VTVTAVSPDGNMAVNYLQIAESHNLTVIHSPNPINLTSNFGGNGKSGFAIFGVVYDPSNYSSEPLPVKLSVLGLDDRGKIISMPPWLSVSIPDSTFSLRPTIPYYFTIEFNSYNASIGTYPVAIAEKVGDSSFTQDVDIRIYQPAMMGGGLALGPSMSSPVPNMAPVQDQSNPVQLIEPIVIGIGLTGGGIFGILYFTREK
jgi:hypothetical protein